MPTCLILQPIHTAGQARLRAASIRPIEAWRLDPIEHSDALATAEALITRDLPVTAAMMDAAPDLAVIGSHGTGVNAIDVATATARGIAVVNTPGANARSVAEHALMLMLAVSRHLPLADAAARRRDPRFKFDERFTELYGLTLGLVGYGWTARHLADMAGAGLGLNILAWSRSLTPGAAIPFGRAAVSLEALLGEADIVSLHLPASAATRGLLGHAALATMKPGAILVNTARGSLIDEAALADALDSGHLGGAGLDVLAEEEDASRPSGRLIAHSKVVLTPHTAGSTTAALQATAERVADAVIAILAGKRPMSLVNPAARPGRPLT